MAYVKIHSGTEAVSMSATEGLSVDATVGCVYRGGSLLPLEYRVGLGYVLFFNESGVVF